ncbi:unnamed protein product, partial [Meganyctiphanes norvegica]
MPTLTFSQQGIVHILRNHKREGGGGGGGRQILKKNVHHPWIKNKQSYETSRQKVTPLPPPPPNAQDSIHPNLRKPEVVRYILETRGNQIYSGNQRKPELIRFILVALNYYETRGSCLSAQDGELCVVETSLETPYFTPVVETPDTCQGCLFPTHNRASQTNQYPQVQQVHIVHVDNPEGGAVQVVLTGNGEGSSTPSTALVLYSSQGTAPIVFTVSGKGLANDTKHTFLVSGDDEARGNNLRYSFVQLPRRDEGELPQMMIEKLGFVTSYTRASRANKIIITLPEESRNGPGCMVGVTSMSPVASCFISTKQPVQGCYHHNMLGLNNNDIHIIEVEGSSNVNGSLLLSIIGSSDILSGSPNGIVERNMTLVLRSSRPTTWSLHTATLQGTITLLMGGEDQVENSSVSGPGVVLEVRRIEVPTPYDQMMISVLTTVGPPVSYTRTKSPNKITITVPPKDDIRVVVLPPELPPELPRIQYPPEDPATTIRNSLTFTCEKDQVVVAVPRHLSQKVGGISMYLDDRKCHSAANRTHIYIKAKFRDCKFTHSNSLYRIKYKNSVHVEMGPSVTDDEDFDGSGYSSDDEYYAPPFKPEPFDCVAAAQSVPTWTNPTTNKTKAPTNKSVPTTYQMAIYRDPEHNSPLNIADIPAVVASNHRLHIQTGIKSVDEATLAYGADLKVILEECWVSNSSSTVTPREPCNMLLRQSCHTSSSVKLEPAYLTEKPGFSFQLAPEYGLLGSLYLHCQLGVCSADSLPRPSVNRCIDPEDYCRKTMLFDIFRDQPASSSLQTLTLGPFTIPINLNDTMIRGRSSSNDKSAEGMKENVCVESGVNSVEEKTQIIVIGLSTEIVVGIALASFIIGVCLTATLWLIHMKTDPRRAKRPDGSATRSSGYDLSAHSGSSTPSSQAPMTA